MKRKAMLLVGTLCVALVFGSSMALAITKQCATVDLDSGDPRGTCFGTPGADLLKGTPGNNIIYGRGGGDTLKGFDSEDWLNGDNGNDELLGGGSTDHLWGDPGKDVLKGGEDPDEYNYYWYEDWGHDTIIDTSGNSLFFYSLRTDLHIDLNSGWGPEVENESGTSTVNWSGDVIAGVSNNSHGDDVILGNEAANVISSGAVGATVGHDSGGDDYVNARGNNDTVYVEDTFGNDVVDCGGGSEDTVYFDEGIDVIRNCEIRRHQF